MQPRITEITGTPMVNNEEISENDLPYFLTPGDVIESECNEEAIIRVATDGYWVIEQNTKGEVIKPSSYYYYRRR